MSTIDHPVQRVESDARSSDRPFIPAAGSDLALPLYDPFARLFGVDALRRELIDSAGLQSGQRVLDVGCGTGTLVIAAKRACPPAELIGLDPDPRALERARRKAARAGVDVRFDRGYGDALPYPDAAFARVFSSLMLHHLDPATQRGLLAEVRRVLEPGGSFHLMDFVHSNHGLHGLFRGTHRGGLQPHFEPEQELLALLQQAGFIDVRLQARRRLLFAPVLSYVASTERRKA
jgi:ubiquinone/menaquinone biosynthesis C-methylase UbiE